MGTASWNLVAPRSHPTHQISPARLCRALTDIYKPSEMTSICESIVGCVCNDSRFCSYLDDLRTIASGLDTISEDDKCTMKKTPMFFGFRKRTGDEKLLLADQVVISDWECRDFGSDVFVAPNDGILESRCANLGPITTLLIFSIEMYDEMGSEYLGTYVQHDIRHTDHKTNCDPQFIRDQVIRRVRYFMDQRDKPGKTDVSFHRGSPDRL